MGNLLIFWRDFCKNQRTLLNWFVLFLSDLIWSWILVLYKSGPTFINPLDLPQFELPTNVMLIFPMPIASHLFNHNSTIAFHLHPSASSRNRTRKNHSQQQKPKVSQKFSVTLTYILYTYLFLLFFLLPFTGLSFLRPRPLRLALCSLFFLSAIIFLYIWCGPPPISYYTAGCNIISLWYEFYYG